MQGRFSIVIPAYNEEKRIGHCLQTLTRMYPNAEIIVSVDGTIDRTVQIARQHRVIVLNEKKRLGKWGGVKRGICHATEPYTVIADADLAVSPLVFPKAVSVLMQGNDVVVGNRIAKDGPMHRRILSKCFHVLVRLLFNLSYDTQTSFMALRTNVARQVFLEIDVSRFAYAVGFLYKCKQRGLRIVTLPVEWQYHDDSSVKLPDDIFTMFRDLLVQRVGL